MWFLIYTVVCLSSVCLSGILHCEGFLYCTDGGSDKENIDPNPDDEDESSSMSAAAARGEAGRPWWISAGLFGDGSAASPSSISAGPPSDADISEGRVLHLRYLYQMSMEQRTRYIIKETMQGT